MIDFKIKRKSPAYAGLQNRSGQGTALLKYKILLEAALRNDELVLLDTRMHRNPSERRIHELLGIDLEFTTLPLLFENHQVAVGRDLVRLVPVPYFFVEEVVLGLIDATSTEEKVPTDAITVTNADELHNFRSRPVLRNRKADEQGEASAHRERHAREEAQDEGEEAERQEPLHELLKEGPQRKAEEDQCKKVWPDHFLSFLLRIGVAASLASWFHYSRERLVE